MKKHTFEEVYNIFFEPGEVTEIRAFGLKKGNRAWEGWAGGHGIVFGYFNNAGDFAKAAAALDRAQAEGIYFTLNPCNPDLLARSANRLKAAGSKTSTTSDKDIVCIRWLPIDLDPDRPAGISSTEEELAYSVEVRDRIKAYVENDFGGEPPILAISGNGAHLLYRLNDLDNDEKTVNTIKSCLSALAKEFTDKKIKVDQSVFNPARIWKLYGTTARKGDHIEERPHRKSFIEPI